MPANDTAATTVKILLIVLMTIPSTGDVTSTRRMARPSGNYPACYSSHPPRRTARTASRPKVSKEFARPPGVAGAGKYAEDPSVGAAQSKRQEVGSTPLIVKSLPFGAQCRDPEVICIMITEGNGDAVVYSSKESTYGLAGP